MSTAMLLLCSCPDFEMDTVVCPIVSAISLLVLQCSQICARVARLDPSTTDGTAEAAARTGRAQGRARARPEETWRVCDATLSTRWISTISFIVSDHFTPRSSSLPLEPIERFIARHFTRLAVHLFTPWRTSDLLNHDSSASLHLRSRELRQSEKLLSGPSISPIIEPTVRIVGTTSFSLLSPCRSSRLACRVSLDARAPAVMFPPTPRPRPPPSQVPPLRVTRLVSRFRQTVPRHRVSVQRKKGVR